MQFSNFYIHLFCVITMNENISFKSRIRFVDRNMFNKLKRGAEIRYRHGEANIIKDKNFFSEEIRTALAAGL